eukprot:1156674-Pelagomonas_calceolata.AAC.19
MALLFIFDDGIMFLMPSAPAGRSAACAKNVKIVQNLVPACILTDAVSCKESVCCCLSMRSNRDLVSSFHRFLRVLPFRCAPINAQLSFLLGMCA